MKTLLAALAFFALSAGPAASCEAGGCNGGEIRSPRGETAPIILDQGDRMRPDQG
jgi:hypothetical protein